MGQRSVFIWRLPLCRGMHTLSEFNDGLLADAKKAALGPIQIDDQQKDRGVGDNQSAVGKR
jgi:hypothetical protein